MPLDFARTVKLLKHDVAPALGASRRLVVHAAARAVEQLALTEPEAKLIEDVPQPFDRFVDTTWPACPRLHERVARSACRPPP